MKVKLNMCTKACVHVNTCMKLTLSCQTLLTLNNTGRPGYEAKIFIFEKKLSDTKHYNHVNLVAKRHCNTHHNDHEIAMCAKIQVMKTLVSNWNNVGILLDFNGSGTQLDIVREKYQKDPEACYRARPCSNAS